MVLEKSNIGHPCRGRNTPSREMLQETLQGMLIGQDELEVQGAIEDQGTPQNGSREKKYPKSKERSR